MVAQSDFRFELVEPEEEHESDDLAIKDVVVHFEGEGLLAGMSIRLFQIRRELAPDFSPTRFYVCVPRGSELITDGEGFSQAWRRCKAHIWALYRRRQR